MVFYMTLHPYLVSIYEYYYEVTRRPQPSTSGAQTPIESPPPYETFSRGHCDRMIEKIAHDMRSLWADLSLDQPKREESDGNADWHDRPLLSATPLGPIGRTPCGGGAVVAHLLA